MTDPFGDVRRLHLFVNQIAELMGDHEGPWFLGSAMYIPGAEQVGPDKVLFGKDDLLELALGLPVPALQQKMNQLVIGSSLVGDWGSIAERLAGQLLGTRDILVTDYRLMVLEQGHQKFYTLWQTSVSDVLSAVLIPRFGQRGRVRLTFKDGSAVNVVLGMVLTGNARRFIEALDKAKGRIHE